MMEPGKVGLVALVLAAALAGCNRTPTDQAQESSTAPSSASPATDGAGSAANGTASTDASRLQATVDDTTVTAKVKAALLASDGIQGTDISVETQQGVVILTGKVADASQAERATQIAQSVEGVRSVDNRLTTRAG